MILIKKFHETLKSDHLKETAKNVSLAVAFGVLAGTAAALFIKPKSSRINKSLYTIKGKVTNGAESAFEKVEALAWEGSDSLQEMKHDIKNKI